MGKPKKSLSGVDGTSDVFMYQSRVNEESFGEEAYSSSTVGETDEGDAAISPRHL